MSSSLQNAVLKGALAGLMAGALVACGGEAPPAAAEKTEAVVEKVEAAPAPAPVEQAAATFTGNTCAGHNVCKALGGCKVEGQNECKGKNPCKGKGGCNISAEEQTKFAAALTAAAPGTDQGGAPAAAHTCKGMNECKGHGGCKVEGQNECKGQNPCKAKGGCKPA